jgi:hypothetical protein
LTFSFDSSLNIYLGKDFRWPRGYFCESFLIVKSCLKSASVFPEWDVILWMKFLLTSISLGFWSCVWKG